MPYDLTEITENYNIMRSKNIRSKNMTNTHYHNHYEIYYLVKGEVRYFIDSTIFDLKSGDMVLIPPGVIHKTAYVANNSIERLLLIFTNDFLSVDANNEILKCFDTYCVKNADSVKNLLNSIENESKNVDGFSDEIVKAYIKTLLIRLTRLTKSKEFIKNKSSEFMHIANYIDENFSGEINLDILCSEFSISKSHLSRQFKASTGFGINKYISLVRIKNAEKLLLTTDYSITKIAELCGFNDSSYFSAVFKKLKGISPLKLRSNNM